ncbi:hypothetical protein [Rheinheimera sp. NSM]|uniref:hypothetical protein n=1 Tax=Rheinheimera sp. NSM TaxID=3457884 RepID=UPI00403587DB
MLANIWQLPGILIMQHKTAVLELHQFNGNVIVSIPDSVLNAMGLVVGSKLSVAVQDGNLIMSMQLAAGQHKAAPNHSRSKTTQLTEEERLWLRNAIFDAPAVSASQVKSAL